MTTRQLRNHICKITALKVFVVLFAVLTAACAIGGSYLEEYYYTLWLYPSVQNDSQTRVSIIAQAVALRPAEDEGYINILDIYVEDGILTEKESDQFQALLKKYQKKLSENSDAAKNVYLELAFDYISCYEADASTRLKTAYEYFTLAPVGNSDNALLDTMHAMYIEIGAYCTEYVWNPGNGKTLNAVAANNLVKELTAMLDACRMGPERERLAYACCLAMLLDVHEDALKLVISAESVDTLIAKVIQVTEDGASGPAAMRLYNELLSWSDAQVKEGDSDVIMDDSIVSE